MPETPEKTFLDLTPPHDDAASAGFWIVPVPYEETASFQRGTRHGPDAILEASAQVEYYDERLDCLPARAGIHTTAPFDYRPGDRDPRVFSERLTEAYATWQAPGRVIGILGGEHTVTIGAVRAVAARHPGVGVLQIDAHADLRQSFEGSTHSHACIAARSVEVAPIVQVGIRALSAPEARFIRESSRVETFYQHDWHVGRIDDVVAALPDPVYLTLDIDGLDPSEAPGTGTPEPGGLHYREVLALIEAVARERTIVGFDLVEVRPLDGDRATEFLAARLVYKIIGAIATRGGTVAPAWPHPDPTDERDP